MFAGELVTSDAMAYRSYVTVNGEVRPHVSWSVRRELSGDLPAQVVHGSGVSQATGTVEWARGQVVSDTAANPWNAAAGWLPKSGDRVVIWAGDGETFWRQFTGIIDETSGDVGSGASSSLIDDYDRLNRRVSHDALLRVMPPTTNGGVRRGVGLNPAYFMDYALRAAGFYVTPPLENRPAISVPAQGSMWPESGNVVAAGDLAGTSSHAQFIPAPWGYAASNFLVEYGPIVRLVPSEPVEFTVMVAPDHSGNFSMNAFYGTTHVQLAVAGSRTVIARLNGVDVCSLVLSDSETIVALLIKGGVWTLRTATGATATGNATMPTTPIMDRVTLSGDANARVAGMQVCYPATTTEFRPLNYTPSAVIEVGTTGFLSLMDASPIIKPTTSRDLLEEISKATLTAMWFDEAGVFRAAPSDVLRNRESAATLTDRHYIRSLSWQDSLLSLRSRVIHDYDQPIIDLRIFQTVLLHQGSVQTLSSGQSSVELISPPDDKYWIEPDLSFEILGEAGASFNSNVGRGSITGAVLTDGTTESAGSPYLTASMEQIAPGTIKVTHTAGTLPAGMELELRYPSASTTIWPRWLKQSFGFVRAFALVAVNKASRVSAIVGPSFAPQLVHNSGPWLARTDNTIVVDRVADFIADQVTTPSPTITGMQVRYDPRRQLGDVITIDSPKLMGVTLTALVVGVDNSASGSYTQSLSVRIIDATTTFTTFGQFEEAHPDTLTYEQWRLLFPDTATYDTFNSDPLRGAP